MKSGRENLHIRLREKREEGHEEVVQCRVTHREPNSIDVISTQGCHLCIQVHIVSHITRHRSITGLIAIFVYHSKPQKRTAEVNIHSSVATLWLLQGCEKDKSDGMLSTLSDS